RSRIQHAQYSKTRCAARARRGNDRRQDHSFQRQGFLGSVGPLKTLLNPSGSFGLQFATLAQSILPSEEFICHKQISVSNNRNRSIPPYRMRWPNTTSDCRT